MPALNSLAAQTFEGTDTYADRVHFVQVYVIEPHPEAPTPSPYGGRVREAAFSDRGQAMTYDERVTFARDVEPLITGGQLLLVDDLRPRDLDNPAWCTYGPCPNCGFLIAQDGTLHTVQTWLDVGDMQREIDDLLR